MTPMHIHLTSMTEVDGRPNQNHQKRERKKKKVLEKERKKVSISLTYGTDFTSGSEARIRILKTVINPGKVRRKVQQFG